MSTSWFSLALHPSSPGWKGCVYPELVLVAIPLLSVQIPCWNVTAGRCQGCPHSSWPWLAAPSLPTCRVLCLQDKHFLGTGCAHTRFPGAGGTAPGVGGVVLGENK